jgi:hypothetical protein
MLRPLPAPPAPGSKALPPTPDLLPQNLLTRDATQRLGTGAGGSDAVRAHKFFKSINWRDLDARKIESKFKPLVGGGCRPAVIASMPGAWEGLGEGVCECACVLAGGRGWTPPAPGAAAHGAFAGGAVRSC